MSHAISTDPTVVSGVLKEQREGMIVLAIPGTDYQLHLAVGENVQPGVDGAVQGVIRAQARRVDVVSTGGRFIEPVYGRPRRLQGRVIATDPAGNALTVQAVCPFICTLGPGQRAMDFAKGDLVAFDVERGSRWEAKH